MFTLLYKQNLCQSCSLTQKNDKLSQTKYGLMTINEKSIFLFYKNLFGFRIYSL